MSASRLASGTGWVVPTLAGGWQHYTVISPAWPQVAYKVLPTGRVVLRGLAYADVHQDLIFTLPPEFAGGGDQQYIFPTHWRSGASTYYVGRIDISATGQVLFRAAANPQIGVAAIGYVSLYQMSYYLGA